MKKAVIALSILAVALSPLSLSANSQFGTVETTRVQENAIVLTTLSASAQAEPNSDGFYSFNGHVVDARSGKSVPLVVNIGQESSDAVFSPEDLDTNDDSFSIVGKQSFSPELQGPELTKTIYSLLVSEDSSIASVVVTDDPIPIIAWLALAGIVSATGISIYFVEKCKSVELEVEANIKETSVKSTAKCNNT